ncbi:MAG TPA: zinc-binding dehydrogenase [Ktedonobacteraceae bacterium]|nr:zinc-binding dehydrogenase [Ktedonobacteraceae bacterium]
MQAIVIDPQAPVRLGFQTVEAPQPQANEALIRVKAISLNRGEVVYLVHGAAGTRLGWDLAGVVEQAAADGSGPAQGTRVVGLLPPGAWAELVAVSTNALAELPPSVSFAQAAALPMAGLTALYAVEHGENLLARPVLVTGASGGVGLFACRLAALAGAQVVGQVRQSASASLVQEAGADHVVVGEDIAAAAAYGPYHLIIDLLGGRALAEVMTQLVPGGTCVAVGAIAGSDVPLDWARVRLVPGARLQFFNLYFEFRREPASLGLGRLVRLVGTGKLIPPIGMEADWQEIGRVAQALIDRQFAGKAVLHIS